MVYVMIWRISIIKMAVYSEDLRVRGMWFKKRHTHREAAEIFGILMRSITIWKKMDKEGKG